LYKKFNFQKHSLKGQSRRKPPVKPTWSKKMTALNTFLEFSLNFLSNDIKKYYKIKEKSCVKILTARNTV